LFTTLHHTTLSSSDVIYPKIYKVDLNSNNLNLSYEPSDLSEYIIDDTLVTFDNIKKPKLCYNYINDIIEIGFITRNEDNVNIHTLKLRYMNEVVTFVDGNVFRYNNDAFTPSASADLTYTLLSSSD